MHPALGYFLVKARVDDLDRARHPADAGPRRRWRRGDRPAAAAPAATAPAAAPVGARVAPAGTPVGCYS